MIIGRDARGWRRFYCVICGHIEWIAPDEELPEHYTCPLCDAKRSAMLELSDPRLTRHEVELIPVARGVWQVSKRPPFRQDYQHFSYILRHPQGLVLYDSLPIVTQSAVEKVMAIGKPALLVVSHCDFVGLAGDCAEALHIPSWMGDEAPLRGNRFVPSETIRSSREIFPGLEVIPAPGHSPGSLALYWDDGPDGPALFSGDAITVWGHDDGRTQLAFFQDAPPGEAIKELAARPVSLLASCGGVLRRPAAFLKRLVEMEDNCARPWKGDAGGVWIEPQS